MELNLVQSESVSTESMPFLVEIVTGSVSLFRPGPFTPSSRIHFFGTAKHTAQVDKVYPELLSDEADGTDNVGKRRFASCASQWRRETSHFSSMSRKRLNMSYLEMLSLGEEIIPLALERLRDGEYAFYLVLFDLVKRPPKMNTPGDMDRIRKTWLHWGKTRGHIA